MKKCPYCKIEVGGDLKKCPLCQSKLSGEGEEPYFPKQNLLQMNSLFFKIQRFIVWVMVIAALGLDFLFEIRFPKFPKLHWSLIIAMWLVVTEFLLIRQFKKGTASARTVTIMAYSIAGMLLVTSWFFGFFDIAFDWIVPITITGTLIANFVLAMIDKKGNAMIYLLSNILIGALPYVVLHFSHRNTPITWIISLLVSVILFVGAVIFKGRSVAAEIRRRLNV